MPKVNSTAIERLRPTPTGFRAKFHTGQEYEYTAPRSVYRELRHSRSVGRTFTSKVRGKYPSKKVSA